MAYDKTEVIYREYRVDYNQEQFFGTQFSAPKMPFYMSYPMQNLYLTEMEYEKDMDRMKELYPREVKKVLEYVEDECDKMEYEGSLMFDEYPDRLMLEMVVDRICQKAEDTSGDMKNLTAVILNNEMYRRRCRHRRCRRWW